MIYREQQQVTSY